MINERTYQDATDRLMYSSMCVCIRDVMHFDKRKTVKHQGHFNTCDGFTNICVLMQEMYFIFLVEHFHL